jgi:peptidoglycan hydrolase-like protein with peptidoglycan-binding domain
MRTAMIAMLASTVLSLPAVAQQPSQPQNTQAPTQQSRSQIRQVQGALDQKGFKAGRQDGVMGRQTEAALRNFQKQQHTQATGKLDNQTLAALGVSPQGQNQGTSGTQPQTQPNTGGLSGMSPMGKTGQMPNTSGK